MSEYTFFKPSYSPRWSINWALSLNQLNRIEITWEKNSYHNIIKLDIINHMWEN